MENILNISYPKVLLVGLSFIPNTGIGVTVSNLFRNWPKDKIAVANYIIEGSDYSICENYYLLKSDIKNTIKSKTENVFNKDDSGLKKAIKDKLRLLYSGLKNYLVLKGKFNRIKVDDDFIAWIKKYNPDIIYSMPCDLNQIPFLLKINKKTEIPLATHIVDNWINAKHFGIFNPIGQQFLNREFKKLLSKSKVLFSISKEMQAEYLKLYKRDFIPFHNPASIGSWEKRTKTNWSWQNQFKIMFAGTIEEYNINEIENLCKVIKNDKEIVLNLYGSIRNSSFSDRLSKYSNCKINGLVKSETIFSLLVEHDLIFLPLTFQKKFRKNVILSMPTKISESMISGTPILVYAQKDLALTKYAIESGWAYVVSEPEISQLKNAIGKLKSDEKSRKETAEKAINVVKVNHDSVKIQNSFINLMNGAILKH